MNKRFISVLTSFLRAAILVLVILLTVIIVRAYDSRQMPDLRPWHLSSPEGEFRASDLQKDYDLEDYLFTEDEVFKEMERFQYATSDTTRDFTRYAKSGPNNPFEFEKNWNKTFQLEAEQPRGGVLLLHGLTDSPYSLKSIAEAFHQKGFSVMGIRLPGHGTVPSSLLDITWEDWTAAVQIGARSVVQDIGPDKPFIICGYSNGGPLALHQAIESLADETQRVPDLLFLFSPAIGVSSFGRFAKWHHVVSWIPYFEKARWHVVEPEYDPYKYNSFPKNAGAQTWDLTRIVQKGILKSVKNGGMADFPRVITFQSLADATVRVDDLIHHLYQHLPSNESELVLFDINQISSLEGIFARDFRKDLERLEKSENLPYRLTVIKNKSPKDKSAMAISKPDKSNSWETKFLDLSWPEQVYSLTHVAIPFSPEDPIYGGMVSGATASYLQIGNLALRGEKQILSVPSDLLMRLRYNPFHSFMIHRIKEVLDRGITEGSETK